MKANYDRWLLPTMSLGRWYVDTPAEYLWLGVPRLTSDADGNYVVVPATIAGSLVPDGIFRAKATLYNEAASDMQSDCIVVGKAEEEGLVFDPPSLLLGRVSRVPGKLRRTVQVRLRSRRPLELASVVANDPALNVEYVSDGATGKLFVTIDLEMLSGTRRWSANAVVTTQSKLSGRLRLYAFVHAPRLE